MATSPTYVLELHFSLRPAREGGPPSLAQPSIDQVLAWCMRARWRGSRHVNVIITFNCHLAKNYHPMTSRDKRDSATGLCYLPSAECANSHLITSSPNDLIQRRLLVLLCSSIKLLPLYPDYLPVLIK